jgi:hypothetical protein
MVKELSMRGGGGGGLWRDHQFKNIEKNHISTWILKG